MERYNSGNEWDKYWEENESASLSVRLYSKIASMYRNFLIGPRLRLEIKRHIPLQSYLLHAGSGAGEVDYFLSNDFKILALDLSENALKKYANRFPGAETIQGDITNLSFLNKKFDAIYNLGVMEHLTPTEIRKSLEEFSRLLNIGGKVILFWPPKYGSSVIFLKFIHFVLNNLLKRNILLHPDEPNKVSTKYHFKKYLSDLDMRLISFRVSARDFFTYCVIVLEKY